MLQGVERLVSLVEPRSSGLTGAESEQIPAAVRDGDVETLRNTDGHFAAVERDGQTVRLARTIGMPLRYFVAKMFHGPFLVVGDRMDDIFEWCQSRRIGWQFDPMYTRMIPAHYLVEIDQIGCPDPAPRYQRFFDPEIATGSADRDEAGSRYVGAAYGALKDWLAGLPSGEPIGIAFSGGIDSTSVLLMARRALEEMGDNPSRLRAFTLDLGGGKDAEQARAAMSALGMADQLEVVELPEARLDLEEAVRVIEDYHPLDVECAAVSLLLLGAIRERYPDLKFLLDGDGGDENLKSYPLEDSDLTISSILRNPMLYQEGWGIDAIKHSLTYSGGLSRSYVRTYAPARKFGFEAFSPYSVRSAIAAAVAMPFGEMIDDSKEKLYALKAEVVGAGVKAVTGVEMPTYPKRRFQDGVGGEEVYRRWKVSKSWCRQAFLRQWQDRLREAWDSPDQMSGNVVPEEVAATLRV
jgi:asparagine synthase (glutamine-hydrolysing)